MANAWGELTWGLNAWGEQSDVSVDVTGASLSSVLGNTSQFLDVDVNVTGSSLTANINSVLLDITSSVFPTGLPIISTLNDVSFKITGEVTLSSLGLMTGNLNSVTIDDQYLIGSGWGRETDRKSVV